METRRGGIRLLVIAVLSLVALACTPENPGASGGPAAPSVSPASSPADGGYDY